MAEKLTARQTRFVDEYLIVFGFDRGDGRRARSSADHHVPAFVAMRHVMLRTMNAFLSFVILAV